MKEYLVFAGDLYQPGGGWSDFRGSFFLKLEAERFAKAVANDLGGAFWQVINSRSGEFVSFGIVEYE